MYVDTVPFSPLREVTLRKPQHQDHDGIVKQLYALFRRVAGYEPQIQTNIEVEQNFHHAGRLSLLGSWHILASINLTHSCQLSSYAARLPSPAAIDAVREILVMKDRLSSRFWLVPLTQSSHA